MSLAQLRDLQASLGALDSPDGLQIQLVEFESMD